MRVYRAKACDRGVLIEILWNGYAHEQGESQDEFCSEAVEVAKLKEPNPCHTCLHRNNISNLFNSTVMNEARSILY